MPADDVTAFSLSPQQRIGWHFAKQAGSRPCVRGTALIEGPLDPQRLQECMHGVLSRYEILRTRVEERSGVPVQMVANGVNFAWLRASENQPAQESRVERDPVLTAKLVSQSDERHRLTLEIASWCADAVSLELLLREIADAYAGIHQEGSPLQYADIAAWLNEMVNEAGEGSDFWRKALAGCQQDESLPIERSSPQTSSRAFRIERRMVVDGAAVIDTAARDFDVSQPAVLLGCWQVLLWRLTEAKRLLVAVTLPGRSYAGINSAIGLFERQVPICERIDSSQTIATLLTNAQRHLTELANWQEYFSWDVAHRWGMESQARFGFAHHKLAGPWTSGKQRWEILSLDCVAQPNTVMLTCTSSARGLSCELHYDKSDLSGVAARNMLRQLETVLQHLARLPDSSMVSQLDLVGKEERLILASFNQNAWPNEGDCSILSLFDEQVLRHSESVAVCAGTAQITYAELDRRANQLANHLLAAGAAAEDVIGVCLDRDLSLIVSLLAIWKAGAAYLPLHGMPEARVRYVLSDSGARAVVTESRYASQFRTAGIQVIEVESPEIPRQSPDRPACRAVSGNLAYVMYTSGSTGEPKGVLVEQRSLLNHMLWALREFGLGERERVLMKTSISFDASVWEWLLPLLQGGTLVLLKEGMHRDPQYLIRELRNQRITTLQVVPTMLRVLVEQSTLAKCEDLVRVFVGGEIVDGGLIRRFQEKTGKLLINLYGPTEATINATSLVMGPRDDSAIGRPVANTHVRVLRADLSLAALGEAGEICIAGAALARGYVGRADDTAEKYVPDPYGAAGTRLYRTGDRARYRPDGVLEFLGRDDGQVKIRGYRIELTEIERALQGVPGVVHAAVLVKERTSGDRQLVAYVELGAATEKISSNEISASLRQRLPEYMCPTQYVTLDFFPRTHSGKLDRSALAELKTTDAGNRDTAPRNAVEERLASIWSSLLGLDHVGVTDNFFEIGGDSIIAIQVVARARRADLFITPLHLFQHQTIEELARVSQSTATRTEAAVNPTGSFPLTPIQQAFFQHCSDDAHHFNQTLLLEIPRSVELPLLEKALAAAYEHHDALRMRFEKGIEGWRQYYTSSQLTLTRRDLSGVEEVEPALREITAGENAALNIIDGPLVRVVLVDLGAGRSGRLLVVAHHLVIDVVSWRILLEDISEYYTDLEHGEQPRPLAASSSYRRWAEGLSEYARTHDWNEELKFWRTVDAQSADVLYADDPAGENTAGNERQYVTRLDAGETRQLLSSALRPYKTQFMELLLSALSEAMHRWRGHQSVRIELEGHGREPVLADVDLTRTVGWFTSIYPMVLQHRDEEGLAERIARVKEQFRVIPMKGLGYGLLRYGCPADGLVGGGSLLVNYLGQLDGAMGRHALFPLAPEGSSDSVSPARQRGNQLEMNAMVLGGCLQMSWTYSGARYRERTIAELAEHLAQGLRDTVSHCSSPQAGGFTPSDVTDFRWGSAQLDAVASAIARAEGCDAVQ